MNPPYGRFFCFSNTATLRYLKMLLTNGESCDILSSDPERVPVGVTINGGGCFLIPEEVNIFLLPSSIEGGDANVRDLGIIVPFLHPFGCGNKSCD